MFGANYISFEIKPSPDGGLTKGTKAEIRLSDRGILQFWEVLQKPRERAIYERTSIALEDEEGLRAYFFSLLFGLVTCSFELTDFGYDDSVIYLAGCHRIEHPDGVAGTI
jgi:hypothetical protein